MVLLLSKTAIIKPNESFHAVSIFLFLLGHTHNLLRSVLHVLFAQQIHTSFKMEAFGHRLTVGQMAKATQVPRWVWHQTGIPWGLP